MGKMVPGVGNCKRSFGLDWVAVLNMVWSVGQGTFLVSRVDVVTPSGVLQEFSTQR